MKEWLILLVSSWTSCGVSPVYSGSDCCLLQKRFDYRFYLNESLNAKEFSYHVLSILTPGSKIISVTHQ